MLAIISQPLLNILTFSLKISSCYSANGTEHHFRHKEIMQILVFSTQMSKALNLNKAKFKFKNNCNAMTTNMESEYLEIL